MFALQVRALSISIFEAMGCGIGGFAALAPFGALIATGSRGHVFAGDAVSAVLVIAAAGVAWR